MKRERLDAGAAKLNKLAAAVVLILMLLFMLYLTAAAFFETVRIGTENTAGELANIGADNGFLNILILAIMLSALYIFHRHCEGLSLKKLEIALMLWTLVLGVCFILSVKLCAPWYSDSYYVTYAAQRAARGDFAAMDTYFVRFPFQLGFVLYEEIFFRLTGLIMPGLPEGYYALALQGVNLLWLMLAYHGLIRISTLLFSNRRLTLTAALLMFFCFPAILSCTFLYGNLPSFACGVTAVWMFAAFTSDHKLIHGLLCALTAGMAVALKLNLLIFFVAIAAVWVLELLRHRSLKSLVCLLLVTISVFTVSRLPQSLYESRSGKSFGEGIPMIAWMAMGLTEGHAGPGWYNETYTVTAFKESGCSTEATASNAKAAISQRLEYFSENPGEAFRFFAVKLRSQWNDPTYESLWVNQVQSSYSEKGRLYDVLCGSGERRSTGIMNQYQQLIFLGVLLSLPELWKKRDARRCILLIIILGGLLYHLLFEAKSQYCLSYFVLMVPMAACGYSCLFRQIENR